RTDGNETYLFSDYADGGSLSDWIRGGRLTRLEQILEVAIQFAWGLHVAHEHGVVHQDVKPSNAVMTADGRGMIGDFGLARPREVVAVPSEDTPPSTKNVRGTWEYVSPEQARKEEVTLRADAWSWGLSVLETFTGGPTWSRGGGGIAAAALEDHLRRINPATRLVMPRWLADVLRRCFHPVVTERWATMGLIVEKLRDGWRQTVGGDYPRKLAPVPPQPAGVTEH